MVQNIWAKRIKGNGYLHIIHQQYMKDKSLMETILTTKCMVKASLLITLDLHLVKKNKNCYFATFNASRRIVHFEQVIPH